jgi:hypothetical protein
VIKVRNTEWLGHGEHIGQMRNAYKFLVENPEGKRPLERSRCRLDDNIIMGFKWHVGGFTEFL